MKKIKQGQTKWLVAVYEPGKIEGYDDQYVASVYPCYVAKAKNDTVWYNTPNGPYICGNKFWNTKLFPTFRKALANAKHQMANIEA